MNEQQQGRTCSCAALMPGECICGVWDEQQQGRDKRDKLLQEIMDVLRQPEISEGYAYSHACSVIFDLIENFLLKAKAPTGQSFPHRIIEHYGDCSLSNDQIVRQSEAASRLLRSKDLLADLFANLQRIDETSILPDGDWVGVCVATWASEWVKRLKDAGLITSNGGSERTQKAGGNQ